ncbi:MAG TPA: MFS transporter [Nitrolancea sp.]|nr:MFS transporter [Nitrolancea sp.]
MTDGVASPPSQRGQFIDVLRNSAFLRLWLVQAMSQTAQNMTNFSLLILVQVIIDRYQIAQANTAIGLTVLSFSVPAIFFSPPAGVIVDRSNKRTILVIANALRGVAVIGFLLMQPEWRPLFALVVLYSITFASGAVGQFFGPALGAIVPLLVPEKDNVHANALLNLTFTVSQIAGFAALGPLLIKVIGLQDVLILIAAIFALSTVLSLTVPSTPPTPRLAEDRARLIRGVLAEMREGLVFILHSPILMKAIAYLSLATASYLLIATLGPEFISGVLLLPRQDIVYLLGPAGLGIVLGALFVGRLSARIGTEWTIDFGLTGAGAVLMLLALTPSVGSALWEQAGEIGTLTVGIAAFFAGLLGLANSLVLVPSQSLLQSASPEEIRARVYATFYTVSNSVAFLPIIFAGALADLFGVVKVLVALGAILAAIGVLQIVLHHATGRVDPTTV